MPQTTNQDLSFLQKCTAVMVNLGGLTLSKKLPNSAVQTESDPDRVNASKKLLNCREVKAIYGEFERLKTFIRTRTLPTPFGKAIYFVPNTLLEQIDAELTESADVTIPRLAEDFLAVYDSVMERERAELGPNFNPLDYDTPEEIRDRLYVRYQYIIFGVPENLPNSMYAREQEKAQAKLSEAVDTMQDLLRAEFGKMVAHAAERLNGSREGKDGAEKPKIFKDTLVTNIRDFLDTFLHRNITNDTELEALCNRAKGLLEGVDARDLRAHEPLRDTLARGFSEITATLDSMMVTRGSRSILFDEDAGTSAADTAGTEAVAA